MAVRYTNTYLDALAFCTVQQLRSVPLLAFILAVAALMAWSSVPESAVGFLGVLVFGVLTVLVFTALLTFQLLFNVYWVATNGDRSFLTEHNVEVTETCFVASTTYTRVEAQWAGVFAVRRSFNRLFVFEGRWRAHCIPRRAFTVTSEFDAFVIQVARRWQEARRVPAA